MNRIAEDGNVGIAEIDSLRDDLVEKVKSQPNPCRLFLYSRKYLKMFALNYKN